MDTHKKNIIMLPFNILYKINPKLELKILFRLKQGYKLNLNDPKTYNEKIQWIKLHDRNPLMPKCVDKYTVREYVESKGCKKILNELIWEGFNPGDIPYDKLPNKFVIKVTHGSTYNIICKDKSKLNINECNAKLKKWLKEKFLPCYGEWFYGIEKPRIIIEKYIESKNGLKDYKVFCFNGEPKYIGVYSDRDSGKTKQELYDTKWNEIGEQTGQFEEQTNKTEKPCHLKSLLEYAKVLSGDFNHVRVDFFIEDEKIYFGELTFTSGAGFDKFSSIELDKEMGKMLNLSTDEENKNEQI